MYPESLVNRRDVQNPLKIQRLRDRSAMLMKSRLFFEARGVCEVDCPIVTSCGSVDEHIDLIPVIDKHKLRYLHSSPEYCMKRLLSQGIGDIYQLSHVFREGEYGDRHQPEFTMAEWYRLGISFSEMIRETCAFIQLFLGEQSVTTLTYREAFQKFAGFDYLTFSKEALLDYILHHQIPYYSNLKEESKDACLNLILATKIEPYLGADGLCVLTHYPATQAALAKRLFHQDEEVAERFEVYYHGVELANGYHELADPIEQRDRLMKANQDRVLLGKDPLPIDEKFLQALEQGLPDCCGVAVGFDRLMMLRHQAKTLSEIMAFDWMDS